LTTVSSADLKAALRATALALRDAISAVDRADASRLIAARAPMLPLPPGAVVAGFMPIRSEIDIRPLMRALAAAGHPLALPVVDHPLRFRLWDGRSESLVPAGQGTIGPPADAPMVDPDVLLVPLAAFDRAGYRIGYGRAHYDVTIAQLAARGRRPLTIGVGFALQEIENVPVEPHDQPVDMILTELRLIKIRETP
jgi:5-formyltetrahydrofolate cyclo-ligase